jgi:hypothetical protein
MDGYRDWRQKHRERTRHLIEYGGLVVKAALMPRLEHDQATLLGALLEVRNQLDGHGDDLPADLKTRWRRRGLRTFDADAAKQQPARTTQNANPDWRQERRDRTRQLIEQGALVMKAALIQPLDDDRATLLGALLAVRDQLDDHGDENTANLKAKWRRQGLCALNADTAKKPAGGEAEAPPAKTGEMPADATARKGQ